MANWAIIIGVDQYWQPDACLKGAVRDALDMRQWLLASDGGNVPPANLSLLLSPRDGEAPNGGNFTPATHANIVRAIERMLTRSGGQGERFFFHFSGHGVTQQINLSIQSAILPSDFSDELTTNSFTVMSLFELFQSTQFTTQFFFIDACRNLALEVTQRLSDYPRARIPVPPVSPQFVMYATQPGVKALEIRQPGDERGAFTQALRKGLSGAGAAKQWLETSEEYVVCWSSLFKHVESTVKAMRLAATPGDDPLIQEPRQYGERGALDPDLAHFAESTFGPEELVVAFDPPAAQDLACLLVGELGTMTPYGPPAPLQPLKLPPRTYGVRAVAPGYRMRKRMVRVDLYGPGTVTVEMDPDSPAAPPPRPPGDGSDDRSVLPGPPPVGAGPGSAPAVSKATLLVRSSDPLARIEVTDPSGQVLAGRGAMYMSEPAPGFYRARLVSPEGESTEETVELSPGSDSVALTLRPPVPSSDAMRWAMRQGGFDLRPDQTVAPSETVGDVAFLKLSTVLALAAGAANEPEPTAGTKLRQLQIPALADGSGVMVLLGDEGLDASCWGSSEVHCWPDGRRNDSQVIPVEPLADVSGIAHAARQLDPGAHWLWLSLGEQGDLVFPVTVLPGRMTLVAVTRETSGQLELHQYSLVLDPAVAQAAEAIPAWKSRDPMFSGSRFAALRRIEQMQRAVSHGRITPTQPDIEQLAFDKWIDPMAGCLAGYLLVRLGHWADLEVPARNLVTSFGGLADAHVLQGLYRENVAGRGDAQEAFVKALDLGLPSFRDGLMHLGAAIERHQISHRRAGLIARVLSAVPAGSLWSAVPDASLAETSTPTTTPAAPAPRQSSFGVATA